VASVKKALATVDTITDVELDSSTQTAKFKAPADLDVAAALNKFVEAGNSHIKGWSLVE